MLACGVLFVTRFLVPAESAAEGGTLWIVVAWLAVASLAGWFAWRAGSLRWRPGRPEGALAALIAAQTASALAVVLTAGQKRAAVNMLWEWIGIGVAFALLRIVLRDAANRRRFWKLLLTTGVLLAGLGLWQRYDWYPHVRASYAEWSELSTRSGSDLNPLERQRRLAELRRELGPELLALQGPSQAALRQRILDSSEPFGRFALANTLGGVLAVCLVVALGVIAAAALSGDGHQAGSRMPGATGRLRFIGQWMAAAVIAATLLLTRSRTAWLSALAGVAGLATAFLRSGASAGLFKRAIRGGLWLGLAGGVLAILALASGAVDRQDLTEAPKSVVYRLQYWTGARQVIRDHPWLGVGPGNFRQHYLRYKLPEASEEISDPHNLFFDVTTTAGLPALASLLWLLCLALHRSLAALAPTPVNEAADGRGGESPALETPVSDFGWLTIAGLLACGLTFLMEFAFNARIDHQLYWLAAAGIPAAWIVDRLPGWAAMNIRRERAVAAAAGLCLTVHLLTSGGIAMPAVALLLVLLWFIVPTAAELAPVDASNSARQAWSGRLASIIAPLLLLACLATAWVPVTLAGLHVANGSAALLLDGRPEIAIDEFTAATQADPLDPRPWRELGLAETSLWQRGGRDAERHFQSALAALQSARDRDPHNSHADRLLGDVWLRRARNGDAPHAAAEAVVSFARAVDRYPNSSHLQADLSDALLLAGQPEPAVAAARRALELNTINEEWLHIDKLLPAERKQQLEHQVTAFLHPPPAT